MRRRPGLWMTRLRTPAGPVTSRVIAVPHAGGGPHTLLPPLALLPAHVEVLGVTLPGREYRVGEPFHAVGADPLRVVDAVLSELETLPPRPTALLGHSMGAALAASLVGARPAAFTGAVLSAPPSTGTPAERAGRWSEADLLAILQRGGHTPAEVLASPTWRRHLFERIRVDVTFGVRLTHLAVAQPLAVPVTLLCGDLDDVAPPLDLAGWQARATAGLRVRTLPGGHFFLLDEANLTAVADELGAALAEPEAGAHLRNPRISQESATSRRAAFTAAPRP